MDPTRSLCYDFASFKLEPTKSDEVEDLAEELKTALIETPQPATAVLRRPPQRYRIARPKLVWEMPPQRLQCIEDLQCVERLQCIDVLFEPFIYLQLSPPRRKRLLEYEQSDTAKRPNTK